VKHERVWRDELNCEIVLNEMMNKGDDGLGFDIKSALEKALENLRNASSTFKGLVPRIYYYL
jgi:hypothetical protein